MTKKKKTKRSAEKHPDLNPKLNLKTRYELYDQDYIHKLSPAERDWLNKFNREYISGSLDREELDNNLHNKREHIKQADDRNNARNRCVLTRAKASNSLSDYEALVEEPGKENYEDKLIQEIDKTDARNAIEWMAEQLEKDEERLEASLISESKEEEQP